MKNKKHLLYIFISFIIIYLIGVFIFSEFSYPGTKINGNNKSFVLLNNLFKNEENSNLKSKLQIEGRNNKKLDIRYSDIELNKKIKKVNNAPNQ
ncbi:hypothetical protein ABGF41_01980, partial [Helcococcus ovis]